MSTIAWPKKTREIHNHHFDSTVWNEFKFRSDDVIVATYAKSGTTWAQQILGQLLFKGSTDVDVMALSPWVDLRVPPKEVKLAGLEAQTNRRFMKTHLPVDALVFSSNAKYIYIGRDGRDVVWSLYNHHVMANEGWYAALNDTPGRVGPPIERTTLDVAAYFRQWLEKDGYPFWSFWENVRSWWALRDLPNVKLVHFNDLKRDLEGQMHGVADYLDIAVDEGKWPELVEHCTFEYMKKNAAKCAPLGGALWEGGGETFINKGTNGRWREHLTADDNETYKSRAVKELGRECANWLANGRLGM